MSIFAVSMQSVLKLMDILVNEQLMYAYMAHLNVRTQAYTRARSCNRKRLVKACIYNEVRWDHRTMPAQPIASQPVG